MSFMRRNREFRPDKFGTNVLNKLYLTSKQRRAFLKWGLYALLLVVLSVMQDVTFSQLRFFGAATDLVPCGIFLICVMEGAENGCVFTLIASWLYLYTGTAPGAYCIVLITGYGICVSILRQAYLQKGFGAALLCVAVCLLAYEMSVFGIGLFLGLTGTGRAVSFLTTVGITIPATLILYPIVYWIQSIGGETWRE